MIDWQQVCLNEKHLNRLARGEVNQPRFDTGIKLLDLHFDMCPDKHKGITL